MFHFFLFYINYCFFIVIYTAKKCYLLANSTLTAVRSWDIILRATVRLYTGAVGPVLLLVHEQHDNTCPNLARLCRQFLDDKGVDAINWPSRSPHLNPIENLWDVISEHQENVQELTDALIQVWQEMSQVGMGTETRYLIGLGAKL